MAAQLNSTNKIDNAPATECTLPETNRPQTQKRERLALPFQKIAIFLCGRYPPLSCRASGRNDKPQLWPQPLCHFTFNDAGIQRRPKTIDRHCQVKSRHGLTMAVERIQCFRERADHILDRFYRCSHGDSGSLVKLPIKSVKQRSHYVLCDRTAVGSDEFGKPKRRIHRL